MKQKGGPAAKKTKHISPDLNAPAGNFLTLIITISWNSGSKRYNQNEWYFFKKWLFVLL